MCKNNVVYPRNKNVIEDIAKKENNELEKRNQAFLIYLDENGDAIIAVGYRVNSVRATQFRQWATRIHVPVVVA